MGSDRIHSWMLISLPKQFEQYLLDHGRWGKFLKTTGKQRSLLFSQRARKKPRARKRTQGTAGQSDSHPFLEMWWSRQSCELLPRHMKDKKFIRSSQHWFTKGKSCLTNLINLNETSVVPSDRTRGNVQKPKQRRPCLNIRKHFCTVRLTKHCNSFLREFDFHPCIQRQSGHGPGQEAVGGPAWAVVLKQMTPEIHSNLNHALILWDAQ